MSKNIDTSLGFSISVEDAPKIGSIGYANYQIPKGDPTGLGQLAKALENSAPKFFQLAQAKQKETDQEQFELGKAKINGITLEEARQASKEGFPDLYNDWAKYGAKIQYAVNSVNELQEQFKISYITNKNNPNYNWQQDWQKHSQQFLADKQGDKEFATAYNEGAKNIRSFIDTKEFERQSDILVKKTEDGTLYQLQNVGAKVLMRLSTDFPKSVGDITKLGEANYKIEQTKFITENYKKYFKEEINNIKNNRPANIGLSKFDDIMLSAMEDAGNRLQNPEIWFEVLQDVRDDGTPPLLANKAKAEKVQSVYKLLAESMKTSSFETDYMTGKSGVNWSSADHKKYGDKLWSQKVSEFTAINNGNKLAGMTQAIRSLHSGMKTQRPINAIQDVLKIPVGRAVTQDNLTALSIYQELDRNGLVGLYFPHSSGKPSPDALKWFYISELVKTGIAPDKAILQVGRTEANSLAEVKELSTDQLRTLGDWTSNKFGVATAENIRFVKDLTYYFKTITGEGGDDYIKLTQNFIDTHYVKVPNSRSLVSKNMLATLGINVDQIDIAKTETLNLLSKKYPDLILPPTKYDNDRPQEIILNEGFDETDIITPINFNTKNDLSNYDLSFNVADGYVYFKPIDKESTFFVPDVEATIKDPKTGKVAWARIPMNELADRMQQINAELQAKQLAVREDKNARRDASNTVFGDSGALGVAQETFFFSNETDQKFKAQVKENKEKIKKSKNK